MQQPSEASVQPRRSFIFSPGLKPEMYPKALASGADIVCVELEDGIAPKDKEAARFAGLALFEQPQADDGTERIVRINCLRSAFGIADVHAVLRSASPPPAGWAGSLCSHATSTSTTQPGNGTPLALG